MVLTVLKLNRPVNVSEKFREFRACALAACETFAQLFFTELTDWTDVKRTISSAANGAIFSCVPSVMKAP